MKLVFLVCEGIKIKRASRCGGHSQKTARVVWRDVQLCGQVSAGRLMNQSNKFRVY